MNEEIFSKVLALVQQSRAGQYLFLPLNDSANYRPLSYLFKLMLYI